MKQFNRSVPLPDVVSTPLGYGRKADESIIQPTNGRIVWFHPDKLFHGTQIDKATPLAAMICHVHSDRLVNLDVVDSNGAHWPVQSVYLRQPEDDWSTEGMTGRYCEWMPYQKGQAKKDENPLRVHIDEAAITLAARSVVR